MKSIKSVVEIADGSFVLKYGQPGCIPCKITEGNLVDLENQFDIPFYSCENADEAMEFGAKSFPMIVIKTKKVSDDMFKDITGKITDNSIMMDESSLQEELTKLIKGE